MKRLSNKCSKNSKNKKFNEILRLEREKVKKGFEMSANCPKIAKVTRIFLPMWKDWATNMAKIARRTNLTNSTLTKRKGQEGLREVREFSKNRKNNKNFSCHVKRLSKKYGKNSKNSSLRKHPFLLALRRWGRFARRNLCDSAREIPYWWRKIFPESGQTRWLVDGVVTLF